MMKFIRNIKKSNKRINSLRKNIVAVNNKSVILSNKQANELKKRRNSKIKRRWNNWVMLHSILNLIQKELIIRQPMIVLLKNCSINQLWLINQNIIWIQKMICHIFLLGLRIKINVRMLIYLIKTHN